jgi:hypothetical protein
LTIASPVWKLLLQEEKQTLSRQIKKVKSLMMRNRAGDAQQVLFPKVSLE